MKLSRISSSWHKKWNAMIKFLLTKDHFMTLAPCRNLSSALSASGAEQCILDSCCIGPNCKEPRVIIVGAGLAGLSAAHRLVQCGIRNFLILEAKERYLYNSLSLRLYESTSKLVIKK